MSFENLGAIPADPMLSLIQRVASDPRDGKIDLGVGVYQDAEGRTPVFDSVKQAESHLVRTQSTKAYLGAGGDAGYVEQLTAHALGGNLGLRGIQTIGGTGALRLAGELLVRGAPERRIWIGLPTWTNHEPLMRAAGLRIAHCDLDDPARGGLRHEVLLDALRDAPAGDAFLVQASGHNPTGIDPDPALWQAFADVAVARRLVPLVDLAYQGLGAGWREDVAPIAPLLERVPRLLVAYSCDKNFGLYRERVGALFHRGANPEETARVHDHLLAIARVGYSMPPDHGAAIVRTILADPRLRAQWRAELDAARDRLASMRATLACRGRVGEVDLAALAAGHGMFAQLPLSAPAIQRLQAEHAVYLAPSGRMNLAGLNAGNLERFLAALEAVQRRSAA